MKHLKPLFRERCGQIATLVCACMMVATSAANLPAQDELAEKITQLPEAFDEDQPEKTSQNKDAKAAVLTAEQRNKANELVDLLSSPSFAQREQSAEALMELGQPVVPLLRERLERASDPEVKLRAKTLIRQLKDGDELAKIKAFRDGQDVQFEGWPIFRIMFGDSEASRDIFIELMQGYPDLVKSFHGTPRDRAVALKATENAISAKLSKIPHDLKVSDGIAMLLPASDPKVPISEAYERQMISILRRHPCSRAPRDRVIGQAFTGLVNAWMRRSTIDNRTTIFTFALQSDFYSAYPLAIKTLDETTDPHLLASAMQVIARFGRKEDASLITHYFDDKRPLTGIIIRNRTQVQPQLCDAAMACIARLHKVSVVELGYPPAAEHPKHGFIYESLFFRNSEIPADQQREKARKKIEQLLEDGVLAEKES